MTVQQLGSITARSQGLFDRTYHHSYCCDESSILGGLREQKVIPTTQETPSGRSSSLGSEVASITLTFVCLATVRAQTLPS